MTGAAPAGRGGACGSGPATRPRGEPPLASEGHAAATSAGGRAGALPTGRASGIMGPGTKNTRERPLGGRIPRKMMGDGRMLPKAIPDKLPGSVQPQYVRCGNPDCRCVRGELHGPYWYRFWRDETGRLRKEYVRLADLEKVRAACAAMRAEARWARAAVAVGARTVDALLRPPGTPPTIAGRCAQPERRAVPRGPDRRGAQQKRSSRPARPGRAPTRPVPLRVHPAGRPVCGRPNGQAEAAPGEADTVVRPGASRR